MPMLPEYKKPPVVEVALAVEFAPLPDWNPLLYGSLWERFRARYPHSEVHPLAVQVQPVRPEPGLQTLLFPTEPPLRYFFLSDDRSQLVQLRSGAFIKNWRKMPEVSVYPRYAMMRPSFQEDLDIFFKYLRQAAFPSPEIWKCEITYVNHFVRGEEWAEYEELPSLMPGLSPSLRSSMLGAPRRVQLSCDFELPDDSGTLSVSTMPILTREGREVLQLSLTASGRPKSSGLKHIMDCMDMGRELVVTSFAEFTSLEVQSKIWGRIWPQ